MRDRESPFASRHLLAALVLMWVSCSALAQTAAPAPIAPQTPKVMAPHRPIAPRVSNPKSFAGTASLKSMVGGLWMTDANFKSSIYLKNVVTNSAVTVTPVLHLSNGTQYVLPNVTLEPAGIAVVSVNDALQQQGIASYATLSGYVEIQYTWPWDPICVFIRDVDPVHSLIFTYPLQTPAVLVAQSSAVTHTSEGMWWKQEGNVTGFVALANTSSQPVTANVQVTDNQMAAMAPHTVTVSPNGTKIVNLTELQSEPSIAGGIEVTYNAPQDSLIINGGLEDLNTGYSATLHFAAAPDSSAKVVPMTFAELGLMVGAADPMMSFPAATTFTPFSVLRNISDSSISVTPTLWWMAAGTAHSAQLPQVSLLPNQIQSLDLVSLMSAAGLKNFSGSVNLILDTQGKQGGLLMAAGSVDQSYTYVFEVASRAVLESASKSISYWSTGNGDDTMLTMWNPADEAQDFVLKLFFSGGHYLYPMHLEARATRTLNISEIIQSQTPDSEGNLIPPTAHEGSLKIAGSKADNQNILVAIDGGTYNVRKATCGGGCYTCNGWVQNSISPMVSPNPFFVTINGTTQLDFTDQWNDGTVHDLTYFSEWSGSSNITINSQGVMAGITAGSAYAQATDPSDPVYAQPCDPNGDPCPVHLGVYASANGSVGDPTPVVQSVTSNSWNAGTTINVTINGTGFGTAPAVSFSDPSITSSIITSGDTQITAYITIPATAPNETVTVTVTSTGYNGSGFIGGGGEPSSGSNTATVVAAPPPTCPTSVAVASNTAESLAKMFPGTKTGVGIMAKMKALPSNVNWNGSQLTEQLSVLSTTCPVGFPQTPLNLCRAGTAPFTVGGIGPAVTGVDGEVFPNATDIFYDEHILVSSTNDLPSSTKSCQFVCGQQYLCGGAVRGNFTITFSFAHGTIQNTPVTKVSVKKQ